MSEVKPEHASTAYYYPRLLQVLIFFDLSVVCGLKSCVLIFAPFFFLVCLICVQLNYLSLSLSLSRSSTCHCLGIVYNSLLRSSRSFSACSLARMNYLISELVDCFSILFIAYYFAAATTTTIIATFPPS